MPKQHKVKQGECISSIAQRYGLLPDTIWNDSANAELKAKRKDRDVLSPGDVVCIPDKRTKEVSGATEQRHRFRKKESLGLLIRLDIDPNDASTHDDRFALSSTDGSYRVEKTVKDDLVPSDTYLDLHYSGLHKSKSYTLQVFTSDGAEPDVVFENVPYAELADLSRVAYDDEGPSERLEPEDLEIDEELGKEEGDPYPEEPDEEEESGVE